MSRHIVKEYNVSMEIASNEVNFLRKYVNWLEYRYRVHIPNLDINLNIF